MSRWTIKRKLEYLGACERSHRKYDRFGRDYVRALRAASLYELSWLAERIQISESAMRIARIPKYCTQWAASESKAFVRKEHIACARNLRAVILETLSTIGIRQKRGF